MKTLRIADLFCGAGGTSTGAAEAASMLGYRVELTAVNHNKVAIATHAQNHPEARHLCTSIDDINPRTLFAEGELDILWASPECTHHSVARGGKPINDQSRATAWCVIRWAEALRPSIILVENVPEFVTWGPIDSKGRPIQRKKGEVYHCWVNTLRALGYRVEWRVLCAADYGDPTTRRRLFIQAVRGKRKIVWPEPTHAPKEEGDLFASRRRWVAARDIIDWSLPAPSIYERKKPLSEKTMARIMEGLRKFGLKSSVICMEHGGNVDSMDAPLRTITTAKGGAMAIAHPFLVELRGTDSGQVKNSPKSLDDPLSTIATSGAHHALVDFVSLLPQHSCGVLRPVSDPAPTITTAGAVALVEPFLVEYYGTGGAQSVADPLNTVTSKDRHALVRPVIRVNGQEYLLDIGFRMLQPHELAAAQGFPADYKFTGTKTDQVKQIGNAVPCGIARALVSAVLTQRASETVPSPVATEIAA